MGAKTLCNACGIRWRLSQAEAAKQKKGDQSPTQSIQYPPHISQLPNQSPQPQQPPPPPPPQKLQTKKKKTKKKQKKQKKKKKNYKKKKKVYKK
jgi:hypothetical protein